MVIACEQLWCIFLMLDQKVLVCFLFLLGSSLSCMCKQEKLHCQIIQALSQCNSIYELITSLDTVTVIEPTH